MFPSPRVEYKLTEYGKTFMPILLTIQDWGIKDMALKN
ncbi:winged helix-turn-helix transcriptional regulator [Chryseobacterium sp. IT-36CA2]